MDILGNNVMILTSQNQFSFGFLAYLQSIPESLRKQESLQIILCSQDVALPDISELEHSCDCMSKRYGCEIIVTKLVKWQMWLLHRYLPVVIRYIIARVIFRNRVGNFKRVFYAHDFSADRTNSVLVATLNSRDVICFGDPPGFIVHPSERFYFFGKNRIVKMLFWRIISFGAMDIYPDRYVVVKRINMSMDVEFDSSLINVQEVDADLVKEFYHIMVKHISSQTHLEKINKLTAESYDFVVIGSNYSCSTLVEGDVELKFFRSTIEGLLEKQGRSKILFIHHPSSNMAFRDNVHKTLVDLKIDYYSGSLSSEIVCMLVKSKFIISFSSSAIVISILMPRMVSFYYPKFHSPNIRSEDRDRYSYIERVGKKISEVIRSSSISN